MTDDDKALIEGLIDLSHRLKETLDKMPDSDPRFPQGVRDYMLIGLAFTQLTLLLAKKETTH